MTNPMTEPSGDDIAADVGAAREEYADEEAESAAAV